MADGSAEHLQHDLQGVIDHSRLEEDLTYQEVIGVLEMIKYSILRECEDMIAAAGAEEEDKDGPRA